MSDRGQYPIFNEFTLLKSPNKARKVEAFHEYDVSCKWAIAVPEIMNAAILLRS